MESYLAKRGSLLSCLKGGGGRDICIWLETLKFEFSQCHSTWNLQNL